MNRKRKGPPNHTGRTEKGHTRDIKVERVGDVTIYKRGKTYFLYYREARQTHRRKIDGNLSVARATAAKVAAALMEDRPSPLGFERTTPQELVTGYLDYVANVQRLAWRTEDRYRAALDRFLDFYSSDQATTIDRFDEKSVEDFVRWLRSQTRTRNGHHQGKRKPYNLGGIKFILSTCRTAFNWATRRRMLPPYADNPFSRFRMDRLHDPTAEDSGQVIFTPNQERDFFAACSDWQYGIFLTLACYGLRAGELTHLQIEDVDLDAGRFQICSKPDLIWRVKTSRRRELPLVGKLQDIFTQLIENRQAGFVFLNEAFFLGKAKPCHRFISGTTFRDHLKKIAALYKTENPDAKDRDIRKAILPFCRNMGHIPVKRLQSEFCKLTAEIGCPEFSRTHDLRHLFSSRAQEAGVNPLLVQEMLGHATLEMTKQYTHIGIEAKRTTVETLLARSKSMKPEDGFDERE